MKSGSQDNLKTGCKIIFLLPALSCISTFRCVQSIHILASLGLSQYSICTQQSKEILKLIHLSLNHPLFILQNQCTCFVSSPSFALNAIKDISLLYLQWTQCKHANKHKQKQQKSTFDQSAMFNRKSLGTVPSQEVKHLFIISKRSLCLPCKYGMSLKAGDQLGRPCNSRRDVMASKSIRTIASLCDIYSPYLLCQH